MSFGWIDASKFSFNSLLLMDRWMLRTIADESNCAFDQRLAICLACSPAVYWYIVNKCPERQEYYRKLVDGAPVNLSAEQIRECEIYVLDTLDWAIVYVYPELMDELPYIRLWDKDQLLSITDFTNKTVLDVGSGTGRLAFAAATLAKMVYACEPVDRLREYLGEKQARLQVRNLFVIDGTVQMLPFPDNSFDIVVSGFVFGEDYGSEYREMNRVTKLGGYIIDCPGEDDRKKPNGPSREMIGLGFEHAHYMSKTGGDVYRYWKRKTV